MAAWREFRRGKQGKADVQCFEFALEENLFQLHDDLKNFFYRPKPYESFYICDPKLRHIHKATVRDRVLHQAVYRVLYQILDPGFIFDSYSCRDKKGTHRGASRLETFLRRSSKNFRQTTLALKCDIRKFFDSVDHEVLLELIEQKIFDKDLLELIRIIINSFSKTPGCGLPLGNVTSQLFANIYLNKLDQFVKHELRARYYVRYCDDFVIVNGDRDYLENLVEPIKEFLCQKLKLELHPNKIIIRKLRQGIDFLGYIIQPHYRILRTKTKRRIIKNLIKKRPVSEPVIQSCLGILRHCRGFKIMKTILQISES